MTQVRKGLRPSFKYQIPSSYKNLITDCWNEDPNKRPTFEEITSRIKNDPGFITENVDKEDFLNYISLIEKDFVDKNKAFKTISLNVDKNVDEDSRNENFLDLSQYEKVSLISKGLLLTQLLIFIKFTKLKTKKQAKFTKEKSPLLN
ncbi:C-terminal of Roc, COR, domain [Tritrichomonas musculus]|uniref:C-terminal of Roc, COR, domain n=1 Tax=Tritrichomonas musculus TaxID=1915356 RepID=A0ABR2H129_9EUKA